MFKKAIPFLKAGNSFLIVSHYSPDGDAIGSSLALGAALEKMGKKVFIYNRDAVPFNLRFLPGAEKIQQKLPTEKVDGAIMIDCAQPKRISEDFAKAVEGKTFPKLMCIDHHLLDHAVGDVDVIDSSAAASGIIIWKLIQELKVKGDADIANQIFCAIVIDTGFFRYSNVSSDVLRLGGELVDLGADPWFVARHLDESNPLERYRLLGMALETLEVDLRGEFASIFVTQKMFQKAKAAEELCDEFANIPRSIHGVEVSAFLREMADGRVKVSLRSKVKVDVSAVAKKFGGGGHEHAAGCILPGPIEKVKETLKKEIKFQTS